MIKTPEGKEYGLPSGKVHLDPDDLAKEAGMTREEVVLLCRQTGVPIYQGRIDKTLFMAHLTVPDVPPKQQQAV